MGIPKPLFSWPCQGLTQGSEPSQGAHSPWLCLRTIYGCPTGLRHRSAGWTRGLGASLCSCGATYSDPHRWPWSTRCQSQVLSSEAQFCPTDWDFSHSGLGALGPSALLTNLDGVVFGFPEIWGSPTLKCGLYSFSLSASLNLIYLLLHPQNSQIKGNMEGGQLLAVFLFLLLG